MAMAATVAEREACNPAAVPEHGVWVFDGILADPHAYRHVALSHTFQTIETGAETWRGIAVLPNDDPFARELAHHYPGARVRLNVLRRGELGQAEPNMVHSDEGHGDLTAILYLHPEPPAGDGTTFWRHKPTGEIRGSARALPKDESDWEPWHTVPAKFGRLLVFDSWLFHSRALEENYGQGDDARLIQVAFFTLPKPGIREATEVDSEDVVGIVERFIRSTKYRDVVPVDRARIFALLSGLLANPDAACLVAEDAGRLVGLLAVQIVEHPLSGERTATELAWWSDEAYRGRLGVQLFKAAEAWARARGAVQLQMVAPNERVGRFYQSKGFRPIETAWQKRIA